MLEAPKTVWVSKHALSKGILECEVVPTLGWKNIIHVRWPGAGVDESLAKGEWHLTREEAVTRAREMQSAEIDSLKQKIEKLQALDF